METEEIALLERDIAEVKPGLSEQELRRRMRQFVAHAKRITSDLSERERKVARELGRLEKLSPQARGVRMVAELQEAEGGAWSGAELAQHFKLSAAVLHRRRREHRVVYWRDAQHEFFYPKWQFNEAGALLPGIQEILQLFESQDEWRVMRYFLAPRTQLRDRRPLDLLRAGEMEAALKHARDHAAENTW